MRTAGLQKPTVLVAGVFADRLLTAIEPRFAIKRLGDQFGNEFIDLDKIDFTNVAFAIFFGYAYRIAQRHLDKTIFINLHGSLLPWGRGPDPHIWNWINGDPHGVTIHKMSTEIDKGPIIVQRKLELEPCEHSLNSTVSVYVNSLTELFRENWIDIAEGTFALRTTDALGSRHSLKDFSRSKISCIVFRMCLSPSFCTKSGLACLKLSCDQCPEGLVIWANGQP